MCERMQSKFTTPLSQRMKDQTGTSFVHVHPHEVPAEWTPWNECVDRHRAKPVTPAPDQRTFQTLTQPEAVKLSPLVTTAASNAQQCGDCGAPLPPGAALHDCPTCLQICLEDHHRWLSMMGLA